MLNICKPFRQCRTQLIISFCAWLISVYPSFAQGDPNEGCLINPAGWTSMHEQIIVLNLGANNQLELSTRLADEAHERRAGYQWICPEEAENTAALFPFGGMIHTSFHMRNVYVPLVILFFDYQGDLVDAMRMLPEARTVGKPQYYRAKGPFQYALELSEGFTASRLLNSPDVKLDIEASALH